MNAISKAVLILSLSFATLTTHAQQISFTKAQVDAGTAIYREACRVCHGSTLANGQFGTPLKGSFFQDKWKGKSLGELVTFVYEKMPPDKTKTLTQAQYIGAVAYILSRNELVVSEKPMSNDAKVLATIKLPW